MKELRRLVRNGGSTQISIPVAMLDHLRWSAGNPIVVEVTECGTIELRLPTIADLRTAAQPMPLAGR